jgi:Uma2 family endonuclease
MQREIVVPETKPATEWVLGRPVQKVSPKLRHSLLQGWWAEHLRPWARGRGIAGPEWRFRVAPPRQLLRPLVPDMAYISYDRLGDAEGEERESPVVAPNVAVEIVSPGDKATHLQHKVEVYLAAGTEAVIVVDPEPRTLTIHDADGARTLTAGHTFAHDALPGFTFAVAEMFAELDEG